jgi:menaquinol-cytochrome c reductase cytochrome b/c subunit
VNEEQKQKYREKYQQAKQKGVKFFPDIIYKDMIVSFAIFLLMLGLATFVGVAGEPKADPNDSAYIPRPEWYFMFLFEMLKYFPGKLEWVGTTIIPGIVVLLLFLLPFIDRNPSRHWSKRRFAIITISVVLIAMVYLTIHAVITTPPQVEAGAVAGTLTDQITQGGDFYSTYCVECHGDDGKTTVITGVEGLEGQEIAPINSQDKMYTLTDDSLFNIVNLGLPNLKMPPQGRAFGGELGPGDIEMIVTYMRYSWDDRVQLPAAAAAASNIPALAEGEVPSYEVHISAIYKRYCVSCHRPGKKNNNYLSGTYEEMLSTGDHAPNLIAGDMNSNTIRMLNREDIEAGGPMPPNKALKPELVDIIVRWIMAGMPETAADAAAAAPPAVTPVIPSPAAVLTTTLTAPTLTAIPTP